MYASHSDGHIFSYYSSILQERYETQIKSFSECVIGYRALRRTSIHFAKKAFDYIKKRAYGVVITMDVSKFFDNLDHSILKNQWQSLLNKTSLPEDHFSVFKAITRYSSVDQTQAYSHREFTGEFASIKGLCSVQKMRKKIKDGRLQVSVNKKPYGIPQGSPISGLLANVYMLDFDKKLADDAKARNAFYRRYCDDIILICDECDRDYFVKLIQDSLKEIQLQENPKKTRITRFSQVNGDIEIKGITGTDTVQYLGFEFDGKRILIRPQTISKHKKKAAYCIEKELKYAIRHGLPRIRRKKIYSYFSHLRNLMVPETVTNKHKRRNFNSYVKNAAEILDSLEIRRQMRRHWAWLHRRINEANTKLKQYQTKYRQQN